MIKFLQIIYIFLLVIITLKFFDARFIDKTFINYLLFITLAGTFILSVPFLAPKHTGFVLPVQMITASILFSVVMANMSWGQSIKETLVETAPYLLWILFFYLLHIKISITTIEKVVLFYGILYILLYFYQLSNSQVVLFGKPLSGGEEFSEQRGMTRIIFPGGGIFVLSIFIAINKLTTEIKNRGFWLLLTCFGLIIPILQVTRQFIVGIFFLYLFHLIRNLTALKRIIIISLFLGIVIASYSIEHPITQGLVETFERDSDLGRNYIRVLAGEYFLNEFSPNTMSRIFGNGVPNWGISNYGIFVEILADQHEYFLSDVGIVAVYVMFGILAIIGFILIWVKSFLIPLPKEYMYLKYYLWFLLITSFTWFSVYHYHYLISTIFVLYIYQSIHQKQEVGGKVKFQKEKLTLIKK